MRALSFLLGARMRYFHERPAFYLTHYGETYECDHPAYSQCTLYRIRDKGLAVIQQRFDPDTKRTWWGPIDPWLTDALYLAERFKPYFDERAGPESGGLDCHPDIRGDCSGQRYARRAIHCCEPFL